MPSSTAATVRCTAWPSTAAWSWPAWPTTVSRRNGWSGVSDGVTVSATAGGPEVAGRGLASATTVSCAP